MFEIYWYGSAHYRTSDRTDACIELARMFACTGLAFQESNVADWVAAGSGIVGHGQHLNVFGHLCEGRRLLEMGNSYEYHNAKQWRREPVHGVRKMRGGGGSYRRVRTLQERRMNMAIVDEHGGKMVRPQRNNRALPNSWDDIPRSREKGWKTQGKRQKHWMKI